MCHAPASPCGFHWYGRRPAADPAPPVRVLAVAGRGPDDPLVVHREQAGARASRELGRAVGLNKSTTFRYVATLAKLGYLQQDPDTKRYSLGPRVVDLGFAAINSMEITRVAAHHLQALSDETGYTVSMAVLDGPDIVYVDRRRSGRASTFAMGLHLHVGSAVPAYCTSMGKVLLAHQDPAELRALLDRTDLARRGPKTITAREQLMTALNRVRHNGIAVNDEELAAGLRSVAAPVRDRSGRWWPP
jgi:IclR family pca regulon transcriptional regulator